MFLFNKGAQSQSGYGLVKCTCKVCREDSMCYLSKNSSWYSFLIFPIKSYDVHRTIRCKKCDAVYDLSKEEFKTLKAYSKTEENQALIQEYFKNNPRPKIL